MQPIHTALLVLSLAAGAARAGDLTIRVEEVKTVQGKIMAALYDSADGFLKRTVKAAAAPAAMGATTIVMEDVPAGEYAIALFHDANGNGAMDRNAMGLPVEDFAFSNNAMGNMGPPAFADTKFAVPHAGAAITVSLR